MSTASSPSTCSAAPSSSPRCVRLRVQPHQRGAFLQLTDLWQFVDGLKTTQVAIWQLPLLISGILVALLFGRLMSRGMTNTVALAIGTVASATGLVLMAVATLLAHAGLVPSRWHPHRRRPDHRVTAVRQPDTQGGSTQVLRSRHLEPHDHRSVLLRHGPGAGNGGHRQAHDRRGRRSAQCCRCLAHQDVTGTRCRVGLRRQQHRAGQQPRTSGAHRRRDLLSDRVSRSPCWRRRQRCSWSVRSASCS